MVWKHRVICLCAALLYGTFGCSGGGAGGLGGDGGLFGGDGGSDNGGEFGGSANSVSKYHDALTRDEAYHLLRRAAFGATPEEVDAAVSRGLEATVDDLLSKKGISTPTRELAESFNDDMPRRWLVYLIESPNPLYEKMAMFWHDRFATSRRVVEGRDAGLAIKHWEMLRENALGDYRTFLQELTIDPLMLIWLDGANSPKDSPNENYAREFWELFTLGRDVLYTEDDIKGSTKAFTGITLLREQDQDARPIYDIINHDESTKTIFPGRAQAANFDYIGVIDLTLEQPEAAEYVARNLFVYFIHDNPSDAVVSDLAEAFVDGDFEIKPLVKKILTSAAMFSTEAKRAYVRSPVEHVVGIARTFDIHLYSEESQTGRLDRLARDLSSAGHELLNPPGVEGWGENTAWLDDRSIINRASAIGRLMEMEYGDDQTSGLPYHLLPPVERWAEREIRGEIVDAIAGALHANLTDEERDIFIEVLDQNGWRAFHLEEPENQPRQVFEMIRLMAMQVGVIGR